MILLVVGLVAVLVVVFIAVILSMRLGHGDEPGEPDLPARGRDRRPDDEDEHWLERDTRRAPRAARSHDYDGPPRRPSRADATGYREPAAARSSVPASAQARGRYDTG